MMRIKMNKRFSDCGMFYESHDKQKLLIKLRGVLESSSAAIREGQLYGRLTYFSGTDPVAFICNKQDRNFIEAGFFRASYLDDPDQLLTGKSKEIRRIRISTDRDIPVRQIKKWIRQSLRSLCR